MYQIIETSQAPQAIGPYSQATKAGPWVFCSGQIPIDPETGVFVSESIEEQTHQVLKNLQAVLAAAQLNLSHVVQTTIFLASMEDFSTVNEIYAEWFGDSRPSRATVAVKELPKKARVEISCIAFAG